VLDDGDRGDDGDDWGGLQIPALKT
jgi:hypothetical protein